MNEVILYTKPDCSLCEEAKLMLKQLSGRYPHHLIEIDITGDAELFARYRYRIPVVVVNGRELGAPLTPGILEEAFLEC